MAETCTSFDSDERTLTDMFDDALELYEVILKSDSPMSSPKLQGEIKFCINILERCTKLINAAELFSSNEPFEEIPTQNIKYLLIPAMLGKLVMNSQATDRINALETAEVYFKDYLKRIHDYEIMDNLNLKELDEPEDTQPKKLDLQQLAIERSERIKKYNEQKVTESELKRLKTLKVDNDEEIARNYYVTYIKSFVSISLDELKSIKQEKPLAKHLAEVRTTGTYNQVQAKKDDVKIKPFKPIIIARNEMQKKVFGAGYPSLPTMTVEEFYKERVAEGIFPAHGTAHIGKILHRMTDPDIIKKNEEKEEVKKETKIETDDPEQLNKIRNMDEYKDTHKRGWGNRMNRS